MSLRPVVQATLRRVEYAEVGDPGPEVWSGHWLDWRKEDPPRPSVSLRCDNGHIAMLAPQHRVHDDGTVWPSVGCSHEGCGWHVWATLEGWEAHESL